MNQQRPEPGPNPPGGQPYQPPPEYWQPGYSEQPGHEQQPGYGQALGYGPPPGYGGGPPGYGQPAYPQPGPGGEQPPPEKGGPGKVLAILVVLALVLVGGGYLAYRTLADKASAESSAAPVAPVAPAEDLPTDDPNPGDGSVPGLPDTEVAACPFTAAQMTAMLGQPMTDGGECLFDDGNGVAQVNIEVHTAASTETTYDYSHTVAQSEYQQVNDVESGDKGFVAYKDTGCEAVVIKPRAGYTITMSNFERYNGLQYEQPMRNIISALPN